jgi:hypothetical protein
MNDINFVDIGFKLFGVIILVLVLLFFLTWTGMVRCGSVPYWCDVYETIMGSPRVLIVHGDNGLGNPQELKLLLQDPTKVGVNAVDVMHIDRISLGNLGNYKLVIVENSRKISYEQLLMFMDYVNINGGRLVWIGDSGVEKGADEIQNISDINSLKDIGYNPWIRVESNGEFMLNFDEFLGLKYVGNYCDEITCSGNNFSPGIITTEVTGNHHLIYGLTPALELRISPERDFSIVTQLPNISNSNIVLSLDQGSVKQGKEKQFQRFLPVITTVGLGERVAYYAYPIEYFCTDNNMPNACILLLKQMFYGMLGR